MINEKFKNAKIVELQKAFKLKELINEDVLDKDWPELKITQGFKEKVKSGCILLTDCDARMRMGKFYTDEEYQKYREESLSRPLPGDEIKTNGNSLKLKYYNKKIGK